MAGEIHTDESKFWQPSDVRWFWEPYIPANCATMIVGDAGSGKTQLLRAIADIENARPGKRLFLSAFGGERFLHSHQHGLHPTLPVGRLDVGCLDLIVEQCRGHHDPVVLIDDFREMIPLHVDPNSAKAMQEFMDKLNWIYAAHGITAIHVFHRAKGGPSALGSQMLQVKHKSILDISILQAGYRSMAQTKSMFGAPGDTLYFTIDQDGFKWETAEGN